MRKTSLLTLLSPFCAISVATAAPVVAGDTLQMAADVIEISNWQFRYEAAKNGITLTDVVAEGDSQLVIPSSYTLNGVNKEVVAISKDFMHGNGRITSLTLPATLTDLGSTETEPMFDVQYQGSGAVSPLATPLPTVVRGNATWRMTVGVKIASDTLNYNKWGSAVLATKKNTLDDYYNDGSMQLYVQKGHGNIIFKLDNADDRYRYSWKDIDGTTLVNDTFTFVLENDGSGGYETKVIFANGEEQCYSITAGVRAELNDFSTLWSSMPEGMDVTVKFDELVNGELFINCPNLEEILVEEGSESFRSIDGVLYNEDATHVVRFPEGGPHSWDIDHSVTRVYAGALHNVDADITFHSNPKISIIRGTGAVDTSLKARFHLVIEDAVGANFDSSNLNTYQSVRYERNLADGVYGTIMLPFVPDAESLSRYSFYKLCGGDADGLTFSEVDDVQANVPYLYALREGQVSDAITGGETTIVGLKIDTITACCPNGVWRSVGCYKADSVITNCVGDECTYYCIDATDNKFYLVNKKINTRPYRVYFVNTKGKCSSASAPQLTLRLRDGNTTQINLSTLNSHSSTIYDLQGRRVLNPSGGIYVVDGKKVVIK